jgi:phosphohistidine phosphatase SixA
LPPTSIGFAIDLELTGYTAPIVKGLNMLSVFRGLEVALPSLRRVAGIVCIAALAACATPPAKEVIGGPTLGPAPFFGPGPASELAPLLKDPAAIAAALKRGGYVIYVRHGRTRYEQAEFERENRKRGVFDLAKCETQRQLSDFGRTELKFVGDQFRRAQIPLDRTYTSRYCRAIESAAFFVDQAEPTQSLSNEGEVGLDPQNKPRTLAFFAEKPSPGKNHFMMAHGGIFWEATGFVIQEAHTVVLDPNDLTKLVARIAPNDWPAIVAAMRVR